MAELLEFKCPNCGGTLKFDSDAQRIKCSYCGTEIDVAALKGQDEELGTKADNFTWEKIASNTWEAGETDNMKVYVCNSCGGEIVADENTGASECPYCGNPIVMKGNFEGDLKPDYIIPFKISKDQAKEAYLNHLKGKKLLPKIFKDQNHIDEMKALYVPFWLFDCDTDASVSYGATTVRTWSEGDYDVTETSYYDVIREGSVSFDNVPVDGSVAMPDELVQSVEPYDFSEAVDFQTAYLAGYLADKYTLGIDDAIPVANSRVKNSVDMMFRSTVTGYSSVVTKSNFVDINNGRAKYAMYPLWILNTTFEGKPYIFSINGQTGKTAGDLPMDKGLFAANFAKTGGIAALVVAAIQIAGFLFF